jgi:hypothetical protein
MIKNFEEFQTLGKTNIETATVSATVLNEGLQTIAAEVADYSQKAFQDTTKVVEKALAAGSVKDAVEIQMSYARDAYEGYVAELNKIGSLYVDVAKKAYKPYEAQFAKTAKQPAKVDA